MNTLLRSHLAGQHHITMIGGPDCIQVRVVRWTFIEEKSGPFYTISTVTFPGETRDVAAKRYFEHEVAMSAR